MRTNDVSRRAALKAPGPPPLSSLAERRLGPGSDRLNAAQFEALSRVRKSAEERSSSRLTQANVNAKFRALGLAPEEIEQVLRYVRTQAPITINFFPDRPAKPNDRWASRAGGAVTAPAAVDSTVLDELLADGEYLDQYVTGTSSGSMTAFVSGGRDVWEKRLFQGAYHESPMIPGERPQYGALNVAALARGAASAYGDCYLLLKPEVAARSTFTPNDSSGARAGDVGVIEHLNHVLIRSLVTPGEIAAAALGRPELRKRGRVNPRAYLEAQVHGEILLGRDVEALVMHERYRGTPTEAKAHHLAKTYDVQLRWHDGTKFTEAA